MAQPASPDGSPAARRVVTVLLLVAIGGTLVVPIYARSMPKLGAFPFFYWYQLVWVPVVAIACWLCYVLLRTRPAPASGPVDGGPADGGPAKASPARRPGEWRRAAGMSHVNAVSFTILAASFLIVTLIGFAAARWRPAEDPMQLNEWGLGGRGFGTFVSWFLLGGDLYTAYTFIAVPALVYATGAAGFYALSYTIMVFPIVFVFGPRLWSVARARGYVTPGEFVRGRYGSQGLGLAVTLTGILATMPYIALQLVGIESVLAVMGVGSRPGNAFVSNLPLIIAFVILAAYTYLAGLRAPALIAFVKDTLIYVTVIVAIIYIPGRLGGWGHIFGAASAHLKATNPATGKPFGSLVVLPAGEWAYATLALGSALALFIYPHAVTGVFASRRRRTSRTVTSVATVSPGSNSRRSVPPTRRGLRHATRRAQGRLSHRPRLPRAPGPLSGGRPQYPQRAQPPSP